MIPSSLKDELRKLEAEWRERAKNLALLHEHQIAAHEAKRIYERVADELSALLDKHEALRVSGDQVQPIIVDTEAKRQAANEALSQIGIYIAPPAKKAGQE